MPFVERAVFSNREKCAILRRNCESEGLAAMPVIKGLETTFNTVCAACDRWRPGYPPELYADVFACCPLGADSRALNDRDRDRAGDPAHPRRRRCGHRRRAGGQTLRLCAGEIRRAARDLLRPSRAGGGEAPGVFRRNPAGYRAGGRPDRHLRYG